MTRLHWSESGSCAIAVGPGERELDLAANRNCFGVGEMSTSDRTAVVTVRIAEPDVVPEAAVIVAVPAPTPVASPVASTDANLAAFEPQTTLSVMSVELPSEKMPFAVKACVWPVAIEAVAGVTTIDLNRAAVTVATAEPVVEPIDAVIVELPAETPVTRPVELTVA